MRATCCCRAGEKVPINLGTDDGKKQLLVEAYHLGKRMPLVPYTWDWLAENVPVETDFVGGPLVWGTQEMYKYGQRLEIESSLKENAIRSSAWVAGVPWFAGWFLTLLASLFQGLDLLLDLSMQYDVINPHHKDNVVLARKFLVSLLGLAAALVIILRQDNLKVLARGRHAPCWSCCGCCCDKFPALVAVAVAAGGPAVVFRVSLSAGVAAVWALIAFADCWLQFRLESALYRKMGGEDEELEAIDNRLRAVAPELFRDNRHARPGAQRGAVQQRQPLRRRQA
jgi:hypothetical protein